MAVEVKYVVVRNGEEKMSFANKKDADAYDKMLDLAESLTEWLGACPVVMEDAAREDLALWLAGQKEELATLLRSGKMPEPAAKEVKKEAKVKLAAATGSKAGDNAA